MTIKVHLALKPTTILNVPFKLYEENFTFIVNGQKYQTNRIIADILSPKICKLHYNDPLLAEYFITTYQHGNFSYILNLINFGINEIPDIEIPFISEVLEILGNKEIEIQNEKVGIPFTTDNIFDLIQKHENNEIFYSNYLQEEIDFISTHFYEMNEQKDKLMNLKTSTIEQIIQNPKLQLKSENQLISFINDLYSKNSTFAFLYEYVHFTYVSSIKIAEFLTIFDINDITYETWKAISNRLEQDVVKKDNSSKFTTRYHEKGIQINYEENREFHGIIDYLRNNSKEDIYNIIDITSSSIRNSNEALSPRNAILFDDKTKDFISDDLEDSWICFDFKDHSVIPKSYTIRSYNRSPSLHHPKSWVIEGSNDKENWVIIDEQRESGVLNRRDQIHTFVIKNQNSKDFRYLRMRQTTLNWVGNHQLCMGSIEFYGTLI